MNKKDGNAIETYIKSIIEEEIKNQELKLKEDDAKEIVNAILPELEVMVSRVVLNHLKALTEFFQEKFKDPKEE